MNPTIHNNYNLSQSQVEKFKILYPSTRGSELCANFGINLNQIQNLRRKYNLVKDSFVPTLSKQQLQDFENRYSFSTHQELQTRFRITRSQVYYLRKKLNITPKRKSSTAC